MRMVEQRPAGFLVERFLFAAWVAIALATATHPARASVLESLTWLGCWEAIVPGEAGARPAFDSRPITCVSPGERQHSLSIVTELEGKILSERMLQVDGKRYSAIQGGCSGWESARMSESRARLYVASETSCAGGNERITSAIHMLTAVDQWLEISAVQVRSGKEVSITRYRAISHGPGRPPLDVPTAIESARIAAAEPLHADDVIEALRYVDPVVVEAMLVETKSRFWMDAVLLLDLAEAGVPSQVIDLMVALSFPDYFVVDETTGTPWRVEFQDPGYQDWRYGHRAYYGYPYWYGYGYGWRYPYPPHPASRVRVGRAVSGRGYTRVRSSNLPSGGLSGLLKGGAGKRGGGSRSSGSGVGGSASSSGYSKSGSGSGSSGGSSRPRRAKRRE